ncbi:M16 family metallopeptidase [Schaalia sp. lx-100]|uniref:M16 family metallopeptidase n=1 Tax=Schaalia sp. lx-100 TaxID=2899081 RepID=UPI001E4DF09D|nr:pitrilysin family protein [Schaalia sp. lx-100]MCD4557949.1 insulinase family protein [Schaalia sp. lx-100]
MTEISLPFPTLPQRYTSEFNDGDTRVERTILECGTRIVTQHVPATRSASIGLWVPVGSRDEKPEHGGSTHFLEHLLFKGTHTRTALDIAVAFDSVGGESNAETGKETTSYWARVVDEDAPMATSVLMDMLSDSLIDPTEFEVERGVILDELAMNEDSPTDIVHEAFQHAIHGDTPLGRPVGGTADAIRAVGREDVWEHYQTTYGPDNLVVAASGNVDHQAIVRLIEDSLAHSTWVDRMTTPSLPRPRRSTNPLQNLQGTGEEIRYREVEQAHVIIGCPSMRGDDERRPVMNVLLTILGGSMSSRLFQEVREKRGLAYTTYAFDAAYSDAGAFGMYAGTSPSRVDEVESVMIGQLEELAATGPTQDELIRVRGQVRGSLALGMESPWARMSRLGRAEVNGRYRTVAHALEAIHEVTADQVRELAAELASLPRSRALVLPKP